MIKCGILVSNPMRIATITVSNYLSIGSFDEKAYKKWMVKRVVLHIFILLITFILITVGAILIPEPYVLLWYVLIFFLGLGYSDISCDIVDRIVGESYERKI